MLKKCFPGTDIIASHLGLGAMRLPRNADNSLDENEAITLRITNKHGEVFNDIIDLYEFKNNYIL